MLKNVMQDHVILNAIIDSVYDAICMIDDKGCVLLWNASAERLYGISKADILTKDIRSFFPNALLPQVVETGRSFVNYMHEPKPDSRMIINAKPIMIEGKMAGAISADRDVTELTKLSQELSLATHNIDRLKEEIEHIYEDKFSFDEMIGASEIMIEAIEMAKSVSVSNLSVLLTGESGTGKELMARAIHQKSHRRGLFVPVNCSAIPVTLFESELFGYITGAFTGAIRGKMGLFETANGGTLFLDEIGDMPYDMQSKLLRVLEDGKVQRIGSDEWIKTDVRIIAATNHDLKDLIHQKLFRSDLYYRLNAVRIHLPPLRLRRDDIEMMTYELTKKTCQQYGMAMVHYDDEVIKQLQNYAFKGNVRELKNLVERFVIICRSKGTDRVELNMVPDEISGPVPTGHKDMGLIMAVEQFEKRMIEKALKHAKGNRVKCAKQLGIPRSTLYFKLDKYQIE